MSRPPIVDSTALSRARLGFLVVRRHLAKAALMGAAILVVAACAGDDAAVSSTIAQPSSTPTANLATETTSGPAPQTVLPDGPLRIATTSGDDSGNRVTMGRADLDATPIEVALGGGAEWVVGAEIDAGVVWVTVGGDGRVEAVLESDGTVRPYEVGVVALPPGMPPTVVVGARDVDLFDPRSVLGGRSQPAQLAGHVLVDGVPVVVGDDGRVFVGEAPVAGVIALHDTRIAVSDSGIVASMSDPTERLTHAVLGDGIEAETVTLIDPVAAVVVAVLDAPDDTVFEAISPMWGDVDGDGTEEIVVTASNRSEGARLVVFSADGELLGQSPPIGRGSRWLNLLAVGAVGPEGAIEIVEVRTPHIGGVVQWYRLDGDSLERQASVSGYSTHGISSRNLDEGLIIDVNGDGRLDVVAPSQDNKRLAALTRVAGGAEVVIEVDLGGHIASNVAAVGRVDGTATLAVATKDGRLLIWP